jgi:predicted RNA-binding Zn ribbon-like protein
MPCSLDMENTKAEKQKHRPPRFELTAGILCLDFVNTLDDRPSDEPKELLAQYADLVRFAEDAGVLTSRQAEHLAQRADARSDDAQQTLGFAIELREAMHDIFWAIVHRRKVPQTALAMLNKFVREAGGHSVLAQTNRHFVLQFDDHTNPEPAFESILWPIVRSAADLLVSDHLPFVRACSSKTCQWLFVDTSKSHRRRWCNMRLCGNRAKVRRFYARQKTAS